ncbi:ribonuclease T2 family protein [Aureimonas jatrophae]|uniref:Ribonuclease T2 n=1 Tax=Aureimonas jatrophae TaxID=1166073 RepID=A0A1H0CBG0_9HYPH|nr:ribonuclease [Aureimonas jatrophae]MBB3949159.1 ribonuclease T2 [Aureimonas jatrophae]SDN55207.1 ribonuclease T2 [Aureimonas jatrophae]
MRHAQTLGLMLAFGSAWMLGPGLVSARAQVPMSGSFTAEASCFATPSIRSDDNPGRVVTVPGTSYVLLGRNNDPGSHYLIRVPGAAPERRWVAFGCGRVGEVSQSAERPAAPAAAPASPTATAGRPTSGYAQDFVLAASWQPAFCETRRRVRECRDGAADADGFTLHGVWPQPRDLAYCGVAAREKGLAESRRWLDLPELPLGAETRQRLAAVMPGVASGLDRYQWAKHGSCWGGAPDRFFARSAGLIQALNASPVRDLVLSRVGGTLSANEIRAAFDRAFGPGAGDRVLVDCSGGRGQEARIQEIRITLRGDLSADASLAELIAKAPTQPRGCREGIVDPPGFG